MSFTPVSKLLDCFLECKQVCTDTRKLEAGQLFIALKGDNFDGNRFVESALAKGAAYAVLDNPDYVQDSRCLLVEDTLEALQKLAQAYRRKFDIPVLAITGSNGKTTTKELVAAVMSTAHQTYFTQGNYNNHIGVPLTLLAIPEATEVAVIEMGANHIGEIAALCEIAEPTHGLITNIGLAHLEGFGGLDGVKKGKGELFEYLAAHHGVAFVNLEEEYLLDMANERGIDRRIAYCLSDSPHISHPNFEIKSVQVSPFIKTSFLDPSGTICTLESQLSGQHNLQNIMTAIAIGKYFKVPAEKIVAAISNYVPSNNRSQWLSHRGARYYLDAYNANPSSMRATLHHFAELDIQPKWVILGDMLELGEETDEQHQEIAAFSKHLSFEKIILVGQHFKEAAQSLGLTHFASVEALLESLSPESWKGAQILVKGSRGMQLERLVE